MSTKEIVDKIIKNLNTPAPKEEPKVFISSKSLEKQYLEVLEEVAFRLMFKNETKNT